MELSAGTSIGAYEILSPLGAGGMGEVYRAHDTKLGRNVALKVLPAEMHGDAECMARFQREAQMLASLNHPHIAAIYGLEGSGGVQALVMELVEGPTLAERIAGASHVLAQEQPAGRPLPLDESLHFAKQVADALEAAHEKSIIHRDLKPANIKITPEGVVKVLDFGLAKAITTEDPAVNAGNSPTLTVAATQKGVILGTASYMSPEQARGKKVERRADIWAFGCVLYEMLTGKRAFEGETVSDVLAGVITKDPDWSALPGTTPPRIRELIHRCLTKDANQRLQAIGEARIAIEQSLAGKGDVWANNIPTIRQPSRSVPKILARALPWSLATVSLLAAITIFAVYLRLARAPAPAVIVEISSPKGTQFAFVAGCPPTLSPDGRSLVFSARDASSTTMLWLRRLDASSAQPLPGTEDPGPAFWSTDSRRIGFLAHNKLQIVDTSGSPQKILSDTVLTGSGGGTWNREGTILFVNGSQGICRVAASGGAVSPLFTKDSSQFSFYFAPKFLPDGKHFLYGAAHAGSAGDTYYASLDGKENRAVLQGSGAAIYSSGFLIYSQGTTLLAQPFDPEKGQLTGKAHRIADQVRQGQFVVPYFDASQNGVLVYQAGRAATETQLAWYERSGKRLALIGVPAVHFDLRLSPDARRVAFGGGTPKSEIWEDDLVRGVRMRLTFDADTDKGIPVWSPDGTRILFSTLRGGKARVGIYQKASSGAGREDLLLASTTPDREIWATDWSHDGRFVMLARGDMMNNSEADIWVLPLTGERKPSLFLHAAAAAFDAQFSPDDRWVAYVSDESGRHEVYVVPFDAAKILKRDAPTLPEGKWLISSAGGIVPRWRRDGGELYYYRLDGTMMAVEVEGQGNSFEVGRSRPLFIAPPSPFVVSYDAAPDGKRFVMGFAPEDERLPLTLVLNWTSLLKED